MKKNKLDLSAKPTRRRFLLGAGAVAAAASASAIPVQHPSPHNHTPALPDILRIPDRVSVLEEATPGERKLTRSG
jgi:hypothetical protein